MFGWNFSVPTWVWEEGIFFLLQVICSWVNNRSKFSYCILWLSKINLKGTRNRRDTEGRSDTGDEINLISSYTDSFYRILPVLDTTTPKNQPNLNEHNSALTNQSLSAVILGIYNDDSYSPKPIEIDIGQTVTWHNVDVISHTLTSWNYGDLEEESLFDSDAIIPTQDCSVVFSNRGDFDYYCIYHRSMVR